MGAETDVLNGPLEALAFPTDNALQVSHANLSSMKQEVPFFARKVFEVLARLEKGELYIHTPEGQLYWFGSGNGAPIGKIKLNSWKLARRVAFSGTIGAAESYMEHEWESPDVAAALEVFLKNRHIYNNVAGQSPVINILENIRHWFNRNTRSGSQRNIAAHYDLGNEFYSHWLDPSMTYSSAIYEEGVNSLEGAQAAKYGSLAANMGITSDSHVLEIGCGWGGFAEYVAKEIGAKITGLTISREQLEFAQKRIKRENLEDRVELKFQDYRDEDGKYDHVASIEMFEAVGEKYWPVYFSKIKDCLKPGGTAGLQIITIGDDYFDDYRRRPDFIQRYIFPGGMLPSPTRLDDVTRRTGLALTSERIFPQDYARTLQEWRVRFIEKWNEIKLLGFDNRFKRMWEFYLFYCEAGFRSEGIDVRQMFYTHDHSA